MELLTSTDPDATGSDRLGAAQGMPDDRSPHSPGTSLAAVSGFQPGPLAQQMELLPKDAGRAALRVQQDAVTTTCSLEQHMDTVCRLRSQRGP